MKMFHERRGGLKELLSAVFAVAGVYLFSSVCLADKVPVFTEPLAPLHFEEDGEVKGVGTDVVKAVFKEAGLKPAIEIYPWKRAYLKALGTPGSFIYTINRTERREKLFKWIGPILSKDVHLYKLRVREDIVLDTIEDARKYTTAVILGHSLTTMFLDMGFREGRELITTPNKEVQMNVFLKGRCDLVTGNEYTMYQSLKNEGYSLDHVEPALFIPSRGYYIGASLDVSDAVVERLREANMKIQQSGLVEQIIDRYIH